MYGVRDGWTDRQTDGETDKSNAYCPFTTVGSIINWTSGPAVAKRPRDASCLSIVSFNSTTVTSRIDYCNAVLAESPKATTDKLQRVLNAAARVVTGTQKYDRGLTRIMCKRAQNHLILLILLFYLLILSLHIVTLASIGDGSFAIFIT